MIEEVKTAYRFLIVLGVGVILFAMSVMVPVISSNADFSIYNTGWNGCSDLGREAYGTGSFLPTIDISSSSEERVMHSSFADLKDELDPEDSAIMIIGPDLPFDAGEGDFIHAYLLSGGIVLLADDVGHGNGLLSMLPDTSTRITGDIMVDLSYMKEPEFSVIYNITPHGTTRGVERLLMNYPSTVIPSPGSLSLVESSPSSWTDRDRDRKRGPDEPMGPFTLLSIESYGRGELVVCSEPSIFINGMRGFFDNSVLVSNLIEYLTDNRSTLVVDESHRDLANPVQFMNLWVGDLGTGSKVGILLALTVTFLIFSTPYPKKLLRGLERLLNKLLAEEKRPGPTPDLLMSRVIESHPDWDPELLRRLMKQIEGGR
ncbi:MAG TPA: DUF4350 domain-containing protein [Euryarchaeota archaeon]|nr:DUF4350 domain-containing protein [Euryarchaeota archaeon]